MPNDPSQRTKYPRTHHLTWSPGGTGDDLRTADLSAFEGHAVVVTEKLDGENTTLYCDGLHARSIDGRHYSSRDWLKGWHAQIAYRIPQGWRLCGENVFARHSLAYDQLDGYFYLFSVWDRDNRALSWPDTLEWAELLDIPTPRILYEGPWSEQAIRQLWVDDTKVEGYVVRLRDSFAFADFARAVAKWVRPQHVQTDQHWFSAPIAPNGLRSR